MRKCCLLILWQLPFAALAEQPLPVAGSDIPVNVLMCKSAAVMKELVKTAYSVKRADYDLYLAKKKSDGDCEVGGGAKISEVSTEPFLVVEKRRIHLLKVIFGGEIFYTNFNR